MDEQLAYAIGMHLMADWLFQNERIALLERLIGELYNAVMTESESE